MSSHQPENTRVRKGKNRMVMILMLLLLVVIVLVALLVPRGDEVTPTPLPPLPPASEVRNISPEEAKRRLDSGEKVMLLDVRTPDEHAEKHIPGSVLLPIELVDEVTGAAADVIPDKDTPVFVYCRSGRRSANAARILMGLGYKDVYNLGGIQAWPYETAGGAGE